MSRSASLMKFLERVKGRPDFQLPLASFGSPLNARGASPMSTSVNENTALREVLDTLEEKRGQAVPEVKKLTAEQREIYRRSNASLPDLEGMWIVGTALETDKSRVMVETGLPGSPHVFKKTELDVRKVIQSTAPLIRSDKHDIREGDKFHFRLQKKVTPLAGGEPWLTLERTSMNDRRELIWKELRRRLQAGETVKGRVLNTSANALGFIVGVAGFLCYLPASRCSLKTSRMIGALQDFSILAMDENNAMVVLSEPAFKDRSLRELNVDARGRAGGRGGRGRGRGRGVAAQGAKLTVGEGTATSQ